MPIMWPSPWGRNMAWAPAADGLVGVALHQSQLLQPLGHQTADGEVYVHILHAGLGHLEDVVVAGLDDAVDLQLALCEASVDGHRAGVVRAVVVQFATGIAEHQAAVLERSVRR